MTATAPGVRDSRCRASATMGGSSALRRPVTMTLSSKAGSGVCWARTGLVQPALERAASSSAQGAAVVLKDME